MSKDKSQNFTEIWLVVPELELFLAHFTLKTPAGTNLISYLPVMLLLLLATPHRKSLRATSLVILSG